jgi:hypothetical protein
MHTALEHKACCSAMGLWCYGAMGLWCYAVMVLCGYGAMGLCGYVAMVGYLQDPTGCWTS